MPRLGKIWYVRHAISAGILGWGAVMALLWIGRGLACLPPSRLGGVLLLAAAFLATAAHARNPYKMPPQSRAAVAAGQAPGLWQSALSLLAPAVALGSGMTVLGPEVPSTVAAGGLAAQFGAREKEIRLLIVAGAASAFATLFAAPLAGAVFGLEFFAHEIRGKRLKALPFLAVAIATTWGLLVWVASPQVHFTAGELCLGQESLPSLLQLAAAVALVGWLYCRSIAWVKGLVQVLSIKVPAQDIALAAALLVAVAVVWLPQVSSNRIDQFAQLGWLLVAVVAAKLILVALAAGTGLPGGTFGPALVIGAGVAALLNLEGAWLLVGAMAFTGPIAGVPIAGIVLVAEATHDPVTMLLGTATILLAEGIRRFTGAELYPR